MSMRAHNGSADALPWEMTGSRSRVERPGSGPMGWEVGPESRWPGRSGVAASASCERTASTSVGVPIRIV